MPRLVLYTYEQPRGFIVKCEKCGIEASSLMVHGGECAACRMGPAPEIDYTPPREDYMLDNWRYHQEDIPCGCGCGEMIKKYGPRGHRMKFKDKKHSDRYRNRVRKRRAIADGAVIGTVSNRMTLRRKLKLSLCPKAGTGQSA